MDSDEELKQVQETPQKRENPLLKRINKMPGDTIKLPSCALWYKNGELDPEVTNAEIVIHPMTTVDEIMMRSPDMLFQGTAIERVISRCAPQILKPLDLLSSDIDYILTYLRKVSYGPNIPIKWKCEKCGESAKNHEYNIPIDHFIRSTKEIDPETFLEKFQIKLSNGQVVLLKPATLREYLNLQQIPPDSLEDIENFEDFILTSLSMLIQDVDGVKEKEFIKEWLKFVERGIVEEIEEVIPKLNEWGTEFKYTIKCQDCKEKIDISTSLNPVAFFMLPSDRKTKKK